MAEFLLIGMTSIHHQYTIDTLLISLYNTYVTQLLNRRNCGVMSIWKL